MLRNGLKYSALPGRKRRRTPSPTRSELGPHRRSQRTPFLPRLLRTRLSDPRAPGPRGRSGDAGAGARRPPDLDDQLDARGGRGRRDAAQDGVDVARPRRRGGVGGDRDRSQTLLHPDQAHPQHDPRRGERRLQRRRSRALRAGGKRQREGAAQAGLTQRHPRRARPPADRARRPAQARAGRDHRCGTAISGSKSARRPPARSGASSSPMPGPTTTRSSRRRSTSRASWRAPQR